VGAVDATLSVVLTRPMELSVIMRIRLERLLMARMGAGVRVGGRLGVGVGVVRWRGREGRWQRYGSSRHRGCW